MAVLTNNAIFMHIPKTGGCTISELLKAQGIFESQTNKIAHENRDELKIQGYWDTKKYHFTFVRHPYEWLLSFYAWRKGKGRFELKPYLGLEYNLTTHINTLLKKCINYYEEHKIGIITECFHKYTQETDLVGRVESNREDLIAMLTLAGEKNINKNTIINYQYGKGINPKPKGNKLLVEKFMKIEAPIIKTYNYDYIKKEWLE